MSVNEELIGVVNHAIERFNKKVQEDTELNKELDGVKKKVQIELSDGDWFSFILENRSIGPILMQKMDEPDIRVISDTATILGVLKKEIKPMKAWVTKKIQIKGSFQDLMRFRKFF